MQDYLPDSRAFWDHVERTTGGRDASWDTFSATFETFMRRFHAPGVARVPASTPVEMVLRYAFDRGSPARAASSERVTPRDLARFLERFGPISCCLEKAARSLFDEGGCVAPWFHGKLSRDAATEAIKEWEARRWDGREQVGVYLFRYSDNQICFSYRASGDRRVINVIIRNRSGGYALEEGGSVWEDLQHFVQEKRSSLRHPVPSPLHLECKREIVARRRGEERHARTSEEEIVDARNLFETAQTLVLGEDVAGVEVLEEALGISREVVSSLRQSVLGEPQLEAKALRLAGDILCTLHRQEEAVSSYKQCLRVVSEAQDQRDLANDGSAVVAASTLSHVYRELTMYFLAQGLPAEALDHFSHLVACTTEERGRQDLLSEFRGKDVFVAATEGLTQASVEEMLAEAISYLKRTEYDRAKVLFLKVLRDARCIGAGTVEARALGNLATADYKTHRFSAAIRRYRTCLQLLRQQGNQVTERKILNYLVVCGIEAQRWETAQIFLTQLSRLAESEDNIETLNRLQERIREGVARQTQQEQQIPTHQGGAAAASGRAGINASSERSSMSPAPRPFYAPYRS